MLGFHQAGAQAGDIGLVEIYILPVPAQGGSGIFEGRQVQTSFGSRIEERLAALRNLAGAVSIWRPNDNIQFGRKDGAEAPVGGDLVVKQQRRLARAA